MTTYLLSVHSGPHTVLVGDEMEQMMADTGAVNAEMQAAGVWVFAGGLHVADTATVVGTGPTGEIVTTDGPFLESKEHIAGFWIIRCDDLDDALSWAAKATVACRGPVEVRPFQD
jgi:hypothetical protein